ncbi:MAG: hypothetical protein SGPRY_008668 [Prymnesium sp.]
MEESRVGGFRGEVYNTRWHNISEGALGAGLRPDVAKGHQTGTLQSATYFASHQVTGASVTPVLILTHAQDIYRNAGTGSKLSILQWMLLRQQSMVAYVEHLDPEEQGICVACSYMDTCFTNAVADYISTQATNVKSLRLEIIFDTPPPQDSTGYFMPTFHTGAGMCEDIEFEPIAVLTEPNPGKKPSLDAEFKWSLTNHTWRMTATRFLSQFFTMAMHAAYPGGRWTSEYSVVPLPVSFGEQNIKSGAVQDAGRVASSPGQMIDFGDHQKWGTTCIYIAQQQKNMAALRHGLELPLRELLPRGKRCILSTRCWSCVGLRERCIECAQEFTKLTKEMNNIVRKDSGNNLPARVCEVLDTASLEALIEKATAASKATVREDGKSHRLQPLRDHMSSTKGSADISIVRGGVPANVGRTKYTSHVYEEDANKSAPWQFLLDPETRVAYCAKRPPRNKGKAKRTTFGCRRPYGNGSGFCNGETQKICIKPASCKCSEDNESSLVICKCPAKGFAARMEAAWDVFNKSSGGASLD